MPWNGSGVFSRLYSWVADRSANSNILAKGGSPFPCG